MQETLVPLKLPPGLFRNGTKYDAQGRWFDGNLMRWVEGYPQPVGGWRIAQDSLGGDIAALTGVPRAMRAWRSSAGLVQVAIGTHSKLYVLIGGGVTDITPTGLIAGDADSALVGGTYGAGVYGVGPYGTGSGALVLNEADTWQLDTFGDYLVGVLTSDGTLYVWQGDTGVLAAAATGAPTSNRGVVVTPERFLVALGADGDVRKVQWADRETIDTWTPTVSNTAGDFTLSTNGRIMCGQRTKNQTLIWTDTDLHTMSYIGGTLIYSFDQVGDNCGIVSPNAKVVVDSQAFWMGKNAFFRYDGFVQPIPCEVHDYVFENFNTLQTAKIWAMTVAEFGEVLWFYPSGASVECDRYVSYNYRENYWSFGVLARTAGVDAGTTRWPMLAAPDGLMYDHEVAEDRGSETPYLESGPVVLDPDHVMRIQRIVPDGNALADVNLKLYTSLFPLAAETENGPYTMANPTDVRLSGRIVRLRVEQGEEVSWRVGTPQLGVKKLGRR